MIDEESLSRNDNLIFNARESRFGSLIFENYYNENENLKFFLELIILSDFSKENEKIFAIFKFIKLYGEECSTDYLLYLVNLTKPLNPQEGSLKEFILSIYLQVIQRLKKEEKFSLILSLTSRKSQDGFQVLATPETEANLELTRRNLTLYEKIAPMLFDKENKSQLLTKLCQLKKEIMSQDKTKALDTAYIINSKWVEKFYDWVDEIIEYEKLDEKDGSRCDKNFPGQINNSVLLDYYDSYADPLQPQDNAFLNKESIENNGITFLDKDDYQFLYDTFGCDLSFPIIKKREKGKNNFELFQQKYEIFFFADSFNRKYMRKIFQTDIDLFEKISHFLGAQDISLWRVSKGTKSDLNSLKMEILIGYWDKQIFQFQFPWEGPENLGDDCFYICEISKKDTFFKPVNLMKGGTLRCDEADFACENCSRKASLEELKTCPYCSYVYNYFTLNRGVTALRNA